MKYNDQSKWQRMSLELYFLHENLSGSCLLREIIMRHTKWHSVNKNKKKMEMKKKTMRLNLTMSLTVLSALWLNQPTLSLRLKMDESWQSFGQVYRFINQQLSELFFYDFLTCCGCIEQRRVRTASSFQWVFVLASNRSTNHDASYKMYMKISDLTVCAMHTERNLRDPSREWMRSVIKSIINCGYIVHSSLYWDHIVNFLLLIHSISFPHFFFLHIEQLNCVLKLNAATRGYLYGNAFSKR